MTKNFDNRAQTLMRVLVESYLDNGQPVGSKTLQQRSQLAISPATIRNILRDLEQLGLLRSPHTSAGRIPTARGFRLFVDNLLTVRRLGPKQIAMLKKELVAHGDTGELLTGASDMVSQLTRMTGLVRIPRRDITRIERVEFLPLSDKRVLVVLILDDREVQNRVIQLDEGISRQQLEYAANYVNSHFAGKDLSSARRQLLEAMHSDRVRMDSIMHATITMAEKGLQAHRNKLKYHVSGRSNLLDFASTGELTNLRELFEAFSQKQNILDIIDQCMNAEGVQLFIGEECGSESLRECSVVGAPYEIDGQPVGVLAVVGPTRMAYDRVIPIVDITAKLLTSALNPAD